MAEQDIHSSELARGVKLSLAISHGIGLAISIALLVLQVVTAARRADPWLVTAASLWGAAAVYRYSSSVLSHALANHRGGRLFSILDHAGEYFLAAAVLAPLCLGPARSFTGWLVMGLAWVLAVLGILFSSVMFGRLRWLPLLLLISYDWIAILLLSGLREGAPVAFALSFSGALTWLVGGVFYPGEDRPARHLLWHLASVAGTLLLGLGALAALGAFP